MGWLTSFRRSQIRSVTETASAFTFLRLMSLLRRFKATDLFEFNNMYVHFPSDSMHGVGSNVSNTLCDSNLDVLTETVSSSRGYRCTAGVRQIAC